MESSFREFISPFPQWQLWATKKGRENRKKNKKRKKWRHGESAKEWWIEKLVSFWIIVSVEFCFFVSLWYLLCCCWREGGRESLQSILLFVCLFVCLFFVFLFNWFVFYFCYFYRSKLFFFGNHCCCFHVD